MKEADLRALAAALAEEAARRFPRWDAATWDELCAGPATRLARSLGPQGHALTASYLRLACEGVGRGYLFPAARTGLENFFTLAFSRILPDELPRLPLPRRPEVLAACFNLGENLESAPAWLRRIFHRLASKRRSLADVEALVDHVRASAIDPPTRPLPAGTTSLWVRLTDDDPRFLPGAMHFLSPTVLCVHDRHRTKAAGREAVTSGVWLDDPPLPLGALACDAAPAPAAPPKALAHLQRKDPRITQLLAGASNTWRSAASLVTSQMIVALYPA